jgi:hypothetical protein
MRRVLFLGLLAGSFMVLGGCAVGQRYGYDQATIPLATLQAGGPVGLGVQDARPYVVSGNKDASFVGLMRGGFGNPFDVSTQSGRPLAVDMRDVIERAMKARGLRVAAVDIAPSQDGGAAKRTLLGSGGARNVLVTLAEWKSDTMLRTELIYDVTLVVFDGKGAELARNRLQGIDPIGPSPHSSVPEAFGRKFEALFNDDRIVAALR